MMDTQHTKKGISPLKAGLTGLVLGVAGATAIALQDESTRKKATHKAQQLKTDLKKWSTQTVHDLQAKGDVMKKTGEKKLSDSKRELADDLTDTAEKLEKN